MSTTSATTDDLDIRCPDVELSDDAIDALSRLLVDAAITRRGQRLTRSSGAMKIARTVASGTGQNEKDKENAKVI